MSTAHICQGEARAVVLFDAARLVDRLGGEQPPIEPWLAYVESHGRGSN